MKKIDKNNKRWTIILFVWVAQLFSGDIKGITGYIYSDIQYGFQLIEQNQKGLTLLHLFIFSRRHSHNLIK